MGADNERSYQMLTSPGRVAHTCCNAEEAGEIGVSDKLADEPPQCGIFSSVAWLPVSGGRAGHLRMRRCQLPVRQPGRRLLPIGVGEGGKHRLVGVWPLPKKYPAHPRVIPCFPVSNPKPSTLLALVALRLIEHAIRHSGSLVRTDQTDQPTLDLIAAGYRVVDAARGDSALTPAAVGALSAVEGGAE